MNKVYVVARYWYDFEDDECNGYELEEIYNNFYSAKQKAISLTIDELECEMQFSKTLGFEKDEPKLKDLLKKLDTYKAIYLEQKCGNGMTRIEIIEKEVNR